MHGQMTMKERLKVHDQSVNDNARKLRDWKKRPSIKFRRVYLIGGESGKADPTDYVVGYMESNGKYIEIKELVDNSFRWYVVDGVSFDTLKQAKSAC